MDASITACPPPLPMPSRPLILLVEDDFLIRLTLSESLADEGYDVLEAATGDEALALLAGAADVRAMLTDVNMPGSVDGAGVGRAARLRFPDLPIIYVTGRADLLGRLSLTHRDRVVPKPYLPSDIAAVLREMVGPPDATTLSADVKTTP